MSQSERYRDCGTGVVAAETAGDFPQLSGILRDAAGGKGNFGIGSATQEQANAIGRAWVGDGATLSKSARLGRVLTAHGCTGR